MPELPEVETIKKGLSINLKGKQIASVKLLRDNIFVTEKQKILDLLPGKKLIDVHRRAKLLIFDIGKLWLVTHLRMSGAYITANDKLTAENLKKQFTRFIVNFTDKTQLLYQDQRTLGKIYLFEDENEKNRFFSKYGIEPLSNDFTTPSFKKILYKRKISIKQFLLDQTQIVGIGNIYASEILFRANISPFKPTNLLNDAEIELLRTQTIEVLKSAIENQGTTFSDYRQSNGEKGIFQKFLKVYNREDMPCLTCGLPIKRMMQNQRSTYFCEHCQN